MIIIVLAKHCDFGISKKLYFKSFLEERIFSTDNYLAPEELLKLPNIDLFASGNL
jgi:hypothetical protein